MQQDEISRIRWDELDPVEKMLLIRDRKDPRRKSGNNQRIPLLAVRGYDSCAIVEEQRTVFGKNRGEFFPTASGNFSRQWKVGWSRLSKAMP
jgi:hypothetical protein